jgi:hypothetical protein
MSKIDIAASELPESSIDGKYNVRYRLVTEDRNQTSSYSDVKTITLPEVTVQVGSSVSGLVMSASSVTSTVFLSNTSPSSSDNKLTFSWTPGENVQFDRSEYDLYAYFVNNDAGIEFNLVSPLFLGKISASGSYIVDPTSFAIRNMGFLQIYFEPKHVVFVITKKTNVKTIYDFKLNSAGTGITNSAGTTITKHNVVTFVSPKFKIQ